MTPSTLTYILYARKSTESEDRQVLSIDSQIAELKEVAARSGITVAEVKTEAKSAKAPGRPVFDELLNTIEKGKVQGIVVWHPDRLSRNSIDTGRLIYLFDLGKLAEVVTPGQVFRNTPSDKFLLSILCSQAKLDNDNRSLNIRRGLKAKVERGMYPGPAPVGYLNEKYAEKGKKRIVPDTERFRLVRKIFDVMLTGTSAVKGILSLANEEWGFRMPNGKPLARTTIYKIFAQPLYAGIFEYPRGSGNWYRGAHDPMITVDEYDRLQILLGRRGRPRGTRRDFPFRGLIRCGECGAMVTAEQKVKRQQNGNVHFYAYYHCTKRKDPRCRQKSIEERELAARAIQLLDSIRIPHEFHEWAMKWLRRRHGKEVADRNAIRLSQRRAYEGCMKKLDALLDMRLAGEVTEDEFATKKSMLMKERLRLEELLADNTRRQDRWLEAAEEALSFARDAREKFDKGTVEERRQILGALGSNLILIGGKLDVDWQNTLVPLRKATTRVQEIHARFEPRESPVNKREIEHEYARCPLLCWVVDEVRTSSMQLSLISPSPFTIVHSW